MKTCINLLLSILVCTIDVIPANIFVNWKELSHLDLNLQILSPNLTKIVFGDAIHFIINYNKDWKEKLSSPENYQLYFCTSFSNAFVKQYRSSSFKQDDDENGWMVDSPSAPTAPLSSDIESFCTDEEQFTISGLVTNTYQITFFLKLFYQNHLFLGNAYFAYGLFNVINQNYYPTFQQTIPKLIDQGYSDMNEFNNFQNSLYLPAEYSSHRKNYQFLRNSVTTVHPQIAALESSRITIGFFLDFHYHGANNRFINWMIGIRKYFPTECNILLISSAISNFSDPNEIDIELFSILKDQYQIEILFLEFLKLKTLERFQRAASSVLYAHEWEEMKSVYDKVDILILLNTLGGIQTIAMIQLMHHIQQFQQLERMPFILLELSNINIPDNWKRNIHGILAPSKAAGFNSENLALNIPISVVYPVVGDEWYQSSLCDTIISEESATSDKLELLYVGRLDTEKCVGLLFQAFVKLFVSPDLMFQKWIIERGIMSSSLWEMFMTKIHLTIIGDGVLSPILQLHTAVHDLSSRITFLGKMPPLKMIEYIHLHRRSIIGMMNPNVKGEPFGTVHSEMNSMGIPVLAFERGGNVESVFGGILLNVKFLDFSLNEMKLMEESVRADLESRLINLILEGIFTLYVGFASKLSFFTQDSICKSWKERNFFYQMRTSTASFIEIIKHLLNL